MWMKFGKLRSFCCNFPIFCTPFEWSSTWIKRSLCRAMRINQLLCLRMEFFGISFFFSNSLAKLESDLLAKYGQKPHDCCFLIRFMMKITLVTNLVGWWMNWHSGRANKKKGQGTNKAKEKSVMQFQNSPTRNTKCIIQNYKFLSANTHTPIRT